MSFNANEVAGNAGKKRDYPTMDAGTYPARLVGLYTLGIQPQRPYKGEDKPPVLELMTTYEFLDEFLPNEDGEPDETKPRWLSEVLPFYNLSQDKAKSTKRYLALDPDLAAEGDWSKLVSSPVNVTITVDAGKGKNAGKMYENVSNTAVMRAKDAAKAPDLVNEPRVFDFYNPDIAVFKQLPEFLQTKMKGAVDFPGSALERLLDSSAVQGEAGAKEKAAEKAKAKEEKEEAKADDEDW